MIMNTRSNESASRKELTREQVIAVKLAKQTGMVIAQDYPQIADNYKAGDTLRKIAKEYGFLEKYGITEVVAINAVHCALHELVSEAELSKLKSDHQSQGSKTGGKKNYEQGLGIFSLTPEQNVEAQKKGGKNNYERGHGIFSLTPERKADVARKSVLARGLTPWSTEEKIYLSDLCQTSEYRHSSGNHVGMPDYKKIAAELESKFGTKRTALALAMHNFKHIISGS
jgi:hypothetical protein